MILLQLAAIMDKIDIALPVAIFAATSMLVFLRQKLRFGATHFVNLPLCPLTVSPTYFYVL
jgi:hypothetical protein